MGSIRTAVMTGTVACRSCGRDAFAPRGLCWSCYKRDLRYGHPSAGQSFARRDFDERWAEHVVERAGCLIYDGPTDRDGYPFVVDPTGRSSRAPRVAWEREKGPIPPGMSVDHRCHNEALAAGDCHRGPCRHRACVTFDHLQPVTPGDNTRASTETICRCKRGHDLTDPSNVRIRNGRRHCRGCDALRQRLRRKTKPCR